MNAKKRTRTRPPQTVTVNVDVDLDEADLEDAGWVYVGDETDRPPDTDALVDIVVRWHETEHTLPARWCTEPCRAAHERMRWTP